MAKPHKEEECEECPEWIFTFADLVMLMMGFFVILWVLKPAPGNPGQTSATPQQQQNQWLETVSQIRGGFGWEPDPTSTDPVDQYAIRRRHMANPGDGSRIELERRGPHGQDPEVTTIRHGKQAAVGGALIFDKGSAALNQTTRAALDSIAGEIRGHRNIVLVKGHASLDDLPEKATAQEKMDLSLRRAQAVADYLTTHGVAPEILRVQGCSTFEPVAQRAYTPAAQAVNRRVDVDATATLVPELQDPASAAPELQPADP
jgi:flagellar motor protein MotB